MTDPRASDSEREAAADRLRAAGAEGRLDADELEERVGAVYAARTHGELARLTEDLPVGPGPREPVWNDERVRHRLASFVIANVACIGIWAASGVRGSFWPVWVLFGTGIALVAAITHAKLGTGDAIDPGERAVLRRAALDARAQRRGHRGGLPR